MLARMKQGARRSGAGARRAVLAAVALAAFAALAAHALAAEAATVAPAPANIEVARADGELTASWGAVANADSYEVGYSSDGGSTWTTAASAHTSTSITITADNDASYYVAVRASVGGTDGRWGYSGLSGPYQASTAGAAAEIGQGGAVAQSGPTASAQAQQGQAQGQQQGASCSGYWINLSPASTHLNVPEGGTATYTASLTHRPTANVSVSVSMNSSWGGDSDITVSGGSSLTFTTGTWSTPQTVTLAAAEDADAVDGFAHVDHAVTSDDPCYANINGGLGTVPFTVHEDDNDVLANPKVWVDAICVDGNGNYVTWTTCVAEGGTATYSIALEDQPAGNATVTVTAGTPSNSVVTLSGGNSVTFTQANWWEVKYLTVSASAGSAPATATIGHTVTSADSRYNGTTAGNLTITVVVRDE